MNRSAIWYVTLFIIFFLIGCSGFLISARNTSQKKADERKVLASKSAFSFENAPKASIRGDIVRLVGVVEWKSRTATEPATLLSSTKIQAGEEIHTKNNGKITVTFPEIGTLSLTPDTDIQLVQTYPATFVLGQTKGTVTYEKSGEGSFSIRTLHLLSRIDSGKAVITVDDTLGEITIVVHTGSVTVGYNDADNLSTVQEITASQTFIYNDETREITIK